MPGIIGNNDGKRKVSAGILVRGDMSTAIMPTSSEAAKVAKTIWGCDT